MRNKKRIGCFPFIFVIIMLITMQSCSFVFEVENKPTESKEMLTLLDIKDISDKSLKEVNSVLGEPISVENTRYRKLGTQDQYYENAVSAYYKFKGFRFDVLFINDSSYNVLISAVENSFPDRNAILQFIGLDKKVPDFSSDYIVRWTEKNNISEITFSEIDGDKNLFIKFFLLEEEMFYY